MDELASPHRPALAFYRQMSRPAKALMILALLLMVATAAWAVYAATDPARNLVEGMEVTDNHSGEVIISSGETEYRSMDLRLSAFTQDVTFTAGMMHPNVPAAFWFILLQAVAWGLFLTAITYMKNIFAYVALVPFAIVWYLSLIGDFIAPGQGWVVSGGWILIILIFAFLLQNNVLRLSILLRFLLFTVLIIAPIALVWFQRGTAALYMSGSSMFMAAAILSVVWLVIIAREPTHLLLLLATNAKEKRRRLPSPVLLGIWIVLLGLEFLLFADLMNLKWVPVQDFPFRPIHLLCIAAVVSVFTLQSQYSRLGATIPNSPFSIGVAGASLFMLTTVAYYTATGEHLFLHMFERLAAMVFFIFGVLHLFFVFFNFGPALRDRLNVFFALGQPQRLMYFFVILLGVLGCMAMEGTQGRKTLRFLATTMYDLEGDREMLIGHPETAYQFYQLAAGEARTVKGNYNAGHLVFMLQEDDRKAKEYFKDATSFIPFPWASVSKANLEMVAMEYSSAQATLEKAFHLAPSAEVANNLAGIWMRLDQPDSAISVLKQGISLNPERAALYSNLGNIYLRYGRTTWARQAFTDALHVTRPDAASVTNALYFNLSLNDTLQIPPQVFSDSLVKREDAAMINLSLHLFRSRDFDSCQKVIDTLLARDAATEAALVDGMLKFETGHMDLAISRMDYIAGTTGPLASQANSFLGVMYFRRGVPEMAAEYFGKASAADTNDVLSLMRYAQMLIDAGDHEGALPVLKKVRSKDSPYFDEANKEFGMLFQAQGSDLQAMLEYDMSKLNLWEQVRISRYAGQRGNFAEVLRNFQRIQERDSTTTLPQLEFARIYRRYNDTSAIRDVIYNLEYALKKEPANAALKTELAFAQLATGNLTAAKTTTGSLDLRQMDPATAVLLKARMSLVAGDTVTALAELEPYVQKDQLNYAVNMLLADLYYRTHDNTKGSALIFPLVNQLNYRNSDYWRYMALFQLTMSNPDGAGGSAIRAISCEHDPKKRDALSKEFAEEIRLAIELYPELIVK